MVRHTLTQQRLKELLHYDLESGIFTWLVGTKNTLVGDIAGTTTDPYIKIGINNSSYRAHRLAVLYVTGTFPLEWVDHKDTNKLNNRWSNLRVCTRSQNNHNARLRKDSFTGVKGVTLHRQSGKYKVVVGVSGKNKYLGLFEDLELAALVAIEARNKYHGDFANHG